MAQVTDQEMLAVTLWGEGRGEPVEGRIAIASVIRNRLKLGKWGESITAVCRAPYQFSCWNAGTDANHLAVMALVQKLMAGVAVVDPVYRECAWIANGAIAGVMRDRVDGATHYHVASMNPRPSWAIEQVPIAQVASHLFYRGIP